MFWNNFTLSFNTVETPVYMVL